MGIPQKIVHGLYRHYEISIPVNLLYVWLYAFVTPVCMYVCILCDELL